MTIEEFADNEGEWYPFLEGRIFGLGSPPLVTAFIRPDGSIVEGTIYNGEFRASCNDDYRLDSAINLECITKQRAYSAYCDWLEKRKKLVIARELYKTPGALQEAEGWIKDD